MDMEKRQNCRLDKGRDFWPLYRNPEVTDKSGKTYKVRYYQDGMFFGVGGVYVPGHVPINELPTQAREDVKKRRGYRPILTEEELDGHDILKKIQEEREALARERAELEKVKTVGKVEEEPAEEVAAEAAEETVQETAGEAVEESVTENAEDEVNVYQCPHCPKSYKLERYFNEHLKTHES